MTHPALQPVLRLLHEPASARALGPRDWDLVIRVGRRADLLARIAERLVSAGLDAEVPPAVWRHLDAARRLALRQHDELRHEVRRLQPLFARIGLPLVLLKGSAYVLGGLGAGQGRMVSDIDIVVPRARLGEAESALMINGWVSTKPDAYDQHYYRTWMHELPPMRHLRRGTVLDVHHALVPLTGALPPQMGAIFDAIEALPGWPGVFALGPADRVLHSAGHLYTEGELDMGLRGLVDLQLLLDEHGPDSPFWPALLARADALGWQAPLAQALRQLEQVLGWTVPAVATRWLAARAGPGWRQPLRRLLDAMYRRALHPDHPAFAGALTAASRSALYLRGHWLRMPPWLLARHLLQKAVMAWRSSPKEG